MAVEKLKKGRTKFVECVNSTVLKDLIDDLLDEDGFTNAEAEYVTEGNPITRDKARNLIDMVIKKGKKACVSLCTSIKNRDPHLSDQLGLVGEAGASNMSHPETQTQPSVTASQSNENTPTKISTQETFSPTVENGITLCPQEVYNKIKKDEAGQIYDIKEKQYRKRLALIINNMQFDILKERKGSEHDETGMAQLLKGLGYQVDIKKNLSAQEMTTSLKSFSERPEHEDSDSTFIVILSHGLSTGICGKHHRGSNSDILSLDDICKIFNNKNCRGLRLKPKVIIIQACRGESSALIWMPDSIAEGADACPVPSEEDLANDAMRKGVIESDFLCLYSSTPDTMSWRSTTTGSLFIQKLIEVIQKEAWTYCLEELFRKVQRHFFNTSGPQMPTKERTTAIKKFYLFPGH